MALDWFVFGLILFIIYFGEIVSYYTFIYKDKTRTALFKKLLRLKKIKVLSIKKQIKYVGLKTKLQQLSGDGTNKVLLYLILLLSLFLIMPLIKQTEPTTQFYAFFCLTLFLAVFVPSWLRIKNSNYNLYTAINLYLMLWFFIILMYLHLSIGAWHMNILSVFVIMLVASYISNKIKKVIEQ